MAVHSCEKEQNLSYRESSIVTCTTNVNVLKQNYTPTHFNLRSYYTMSESRSHITIPVGMSSLVPRPRNSVVLTTLQLWWKTCALRNYECKSFSFYQCYSRTGKFSVIYLFIYFFTVARLNMSRVASLTLLFRTAAQQKVAMSTVETRII